MRPLFVLAVMLAACPAFCQIDLSGEWSNLTHEDVNHRQSVEIGDYTGLPINEAGLFKSLSWDEAVLATHERQCIPHPVTYAMRGQPVSSSAATQETVRWSLRTRLFSRR